MERTLAWLKRDRRLAVRHERRDDIPRAFLTVACCFVCHGHLKGVRNALSECGAPQLPGCWRRPGPKRSG
jgi:hypothetical protein